MYVQGFYIYLVYEFVCTGEIHNTHICIVYVQGLHGLQKFTRFLALFLS